MRYSDFLPISLSGDISYIDILSEVIKPSVIGLLLSCLVISMISTAYCTTHVD